jgi:polar amino acid transport system substrate-binding protein
MRFQADRYRFLSAGLLLATLTLISSGPVPAQTKKLSLVTVAALPPLSASMDRPGFLNILVAGAFQRIGVEVEVTIVPAQRALINVNSGVDDGDIFRAPGVERDFPNLIQVPEPLLGYDFVAYTKRPDIQIRNWDDLKPYSVGYASGWKIYENNVKNVKEVTTTPSILELFALLEKGRVDVILLDRWGGQSIVHEMGYKLKPLEPALAHTNMFMYLNKKHAELVPKVAQALRDMKADGSYKKIYDATLKSLDTR